MNKAAAMVRRNGVLALALSSHLSKTSAFQHHHHGLVGRPSTPSSSSIICRCKSTSSKVSDDPSLRNKEVDYEWLKQSRPMRIHARLISPNSDGERTNNSIKGASSSVTKIVHFQRHGQGTHNELYRQWTEKTGKPLDLSETDPEKNPLLLPDIIDSPLTQKGRDQCAQQRLAASELKGVELVIVSPLTRALQTAHITFEDHLPYNNPQGDIQWIAHEGIREELGTLMCNKRRPLSETQLEFPAVDYTYLPHAGEDDVVWDGHAVKTSSAAGNPNGSTTPQRESTEDMSHRAYDFLVNFLHSRPEREVAVVGHSAWLMAMTGAVLDVGGMEEEGSSGDLMTSMFGQAEMRSMELIFLEQ